EIEKYSFLYQSNNHIEDVFLQILNHNTIQSCLNSLIIKEAQLARSIEPRLQDNLTNWFQRGKNVDWLSNKYNIYPSVVKKTLNKTIGTQWEKQLQKREKSNISVKLDAQVMRAANAIASKNLAVSAKKLSEQFGVTSKDIMEILRRNNFEGRTLGKSPPLEPYIIKMVIETQKQKIAEDIPMTAKQLSEYIYRKTGKNISGVSIIRILASNGMKTKLQKRDPILTDLLNKFWITYRKGFWSTLSGMDDEQQMKTITNAIDYTFKDYDENRMMKQYFLTNKIQLRDALVKRPKIDPKKNTYYKELSIQTKQEISNMISQGLGVKAISNRTGIDSLTIKDFIDTQQWMNFQLDPRHPSNMLGKDNTGI
ncbi:MAG: hypothetical protein J7L15_08670, partial [Clostridiales bacterium]|nr:hypothetical protein [Clostridiales bacterium]